MAAPSSSSSSAGSARELEEMLLNVDGLVSQLTEHSAGCGLGSSVFEVSQKMSDIESSKLLVSLAYAVASVYYSGMNATATPSPPAHPIQQHLSRIKQYVGQIQEIEKESKAAKEIESESKSAGAEKEKVKSNSKSVGSEKEKVKSNSKSSKEEEKVKSNSKSSGAEKEKEEEEGSSQKKSKKRKKSSS